MKRYRLGCQEEVAILGSKTVLFFKITNTICNNLRIAAPIGVG
jgi:hypothetical protein